MAAMNSISSFLAAGTKVRYEAHEGDFSEAGIVVHCWMDEDIGEYDCYVAFFGEEFPAEKPTQKPYVLRYAAASLRVVTE